MSVSFGWARGSGAPSAGRLVPWAGTARTAWPVARLPSRRTADLHPDCDAPQVVMDRPVEQFPRPGPSGGPGGR
ncbi:MAG: hypothetical protein EOP86_11495 [Verrucomicrobiaceae bacterium]|nr:MAG: hypothetical protein EOP86_11495 [Verrucomicrobiaceae bacterium]